MSLNVKFFVQNKSLTKIVYVLGPCNDPQYFSNDSVIRRTIEATFL